MKKYFFKFWPILIFVLYFFLVYRQFIFKGLLPIPSDNIVGLYYPWHDSMPDQYPNGIPFKNSLITDAVRQEYPWRKLAIDQLKLGKWPAWNPYSFSGYPLAANLQSAAFYPLNFLYFLIKNFSLAWSIQILIQTLLGGAVMALFLRNLKLSKEAVVLGVISWVGCGFFISWLETNMVVQSVIWLPLILYSIDRYTIGKKLWPYLLCSLGLVSSFLAGHLQSTFYVITTAYLYCLFRSFENRSFKPLIFTIISTLASAVIALPVLIPAAQFIGLSGRGLDQSVWDKPDWLLPWQNLVQYIAPDYFGNPATLNYFGVWNYAEFVGYIGLTSLLFGLSAIFSRKKETRVFTIILLLSLLFVLPTPVAKIPFQFSWPLIASSQPSRIIVIISFCLSVLAAFGLNGFQHEKKSRSIYIPLGIIFVSFITAWVIAMQNHWTVSLRNLILPVGEFVVISTAVILAVRYFKIKQIVVVGLLIVLAVDSSHFATKFLPFTPSKWLYPQTKIISYLTDNSKTETFRIAAMEDVEIPDNFSILYKIQAASGYDPLYLLRYARFMAAIDRNTPDITPPFNFNRIIRTRSIQSNLYPLLNVKYIFSPFELFSPTAHKVMQEGNTRLYELTNYLPRSFFVEKTINTTNETETINAMFTAGYNPEKTAVVEAASEQKTWSKGSAKIIKYEPNEVIIETNNNGAGFLVLTDVYYPSWHVDVNNQRGKIFITDFVFRGVIVPPGRQLVRFSTRIY